jgi:mevalonate kinase
VSLARALNDEFKLALSIDQINQIAWEGEFAYHGIPSGVDNTASCYGGLLLYQLKNKQRIVEKIEVKNPIEIVLANSGISADTRLLDVLVDQMKEKDRPLFDRRMKEITGQSLKMKRHLENGELDQVGKLMVENHQVLIEIGLSHEKLITLCNLALRLGALGAKLTGGGMGGYMVALTPGKTLQEKVAKAMESEGFFVIRAQIGGK